RREREGADEREQGAEQRGIPDGRGHECAQHRAALGGQRGGAAGAAGCAPNAVAPAPERLRDRRGGSCDVGRAGCPDAAWTAQWALKLNPAMTFMSGESEKPSFISAKKRLPFLASTSAPAMNWPPETVLVLSDP